MKVARGASEYSKVSQVRRTGGPRYTTRQLLHLLFVLPATSLTVHLTGRFPYYLSYRPPYLLPALLAALHLLFSLDT